MSAKGDCMFDASTLVEKIPDEYKPMVALGIGSLTLVGLALFHGICLHIISIQQRRKQRQLRVGRPKLAAGAFLFGWSVFLMLALHAVEITMWAFVIVHMGFVKHAYDAIYYCANTYTTLGVGSVDIDKNWRSIGPIIAISGLFTFAWTTSALVDVAASNRRLMEQLEDEREREMEMRFTLRKEEWDARKTERDLERSDQEKTKAQYSGTSFFQRLKVWKGERIREEGFRSAERADVVELRKKERQGEEELGQAAVPSDQEDKDKRQE
jgi:Ion channel